MVLDQKVVKNSYKTAVFRATFTRLLPNVPSSSPTPDGYQKYTPKTVKKSCFRGIYVKTAVLTDFSNTEPWGRLNLTDCTGKQLFY